jgi:hypothetical protein
MYMIPRREQDTYRIILIDNNLQKLIKKLINIMNDANSLDSINQIKLQNSKFLKNLSRIQNFNGVVWKSKILIAIVSFF